MPSSSLLAPFLKPRSASAFSDQPEAGRDERPSGSWAGDHAAWPWLSLARLRWLWLVGLVLQPKRPRSDLCPFRRGYHERETVAEVYGNVRVPAQPTGATSARQPSRQTGTELGWSPAPTTLAPDLSRYRRQEPLLIPRLPLAGPKLDSCLAHGFCIVAPPQTCQAPSLRLRAFGLIYPSRQPPQEWQREHKTRP